MNLNTPDQKRPDALLLFEEIKNQFNKSDDASYMVEREGKEDLFYQLGITFHPGDKISVRSKTLILHKGKNTVNKFDITFSTFQALQSYVIKNKVILTKRQHISLSAQPFNTTGILLPVTQMLFKALAGLLKTHDNKNSRKWTHNCRKGLNS